VAAVQERVNAVIPTLVATNPVGAPGLVVSAVVVTARAELTGETLPALSWASTVMLYPAKGTSPVIASDDDVGEPTRTPLLKTS
jgi:hypothetical protein